MGGRRCEPVLGLLPTPPQPLDSTRGKRGTMNIHAPTMRQQFAAQAVIEELLRQHADTPPRSTFARFCGNSPLRSDSVSWYLGAKGEIVVGQILSTLPPDWTPFHALPIGKKGSDIDHIVIGPGGIFTINTKYHAGKIVWVAGRGLMVSGQKQPYIRNAEYEAGWVTKLLRERMPLLPAAQPVLALVNPKSLTVKVQPEQVKVTTAAALRRWLVKRPVVLNAGDLAELAAVIDDPATWAAPLFPPTENVLARFNALDAEVLAARTRGTQWRVFGFVASVAALLVAGPPVSAVIVSILMGAAL
ncbi:NERD domain-containing protein [Cryobacterium sp. TMT1-19]|nr:NERD domain-containing protein [Cryobacterium sp. TMT1-19]